MVRTIRSNEKNGHHVWTGKDWKEKRSEIINDDSVCAWCCSKEKLVIHHPPGTDVSSRIYQIQYQIKKEFNEATKKERPDITSDRRALFAYRKERFFPWLQESKNYDTWTHARQLAMDAYESLEGTIIICSRCHFATHNGMQLCHFCKAKYHPVRFSACPECGKKQREESEQYEKEMNALGYI